MEHVFVLDEKVYAPSEWHHSSLSSLEIHVEIQIHVLVADLREGLPSRNPEAWVNIKLILPYFCNVHFLGV